MIRRSQRRRAPCAIFLLFAAVLVTVPAATADEAAAHDQTEQRCDYDPLTNVPFNCRQVPVTHTHTAPIIAPPPDTTPRPPSCPSGQHSNGGAGRNCHAHSFTPPSCGTGTWSPGHGHTPVPQRPCPPPTTTTPPPPSCPSGQHSNGGAGRNCHAHSFTPPSCGTGTWSPGHGHTPVPRRPCPPRECSSTQHDHGTTSCHTETPANHHCTNTDHHQHPHGTGTCHSSTPSNHHCSSTAHWHGSTSCHPETPANHHCETTEHQHPHGSGTCHANTATIHHCTGTAHTHGSTNCHTSTPTNHHCDAAEHQHTHGAGGCHTNTATSHHCTGTGHWHGSTSCHTETPANHHCETTEHQHPHGSGTCHTSTPADHHNDGDGDGTSVTCHQWTESTLDSLNNLNPQGGYDITPAPSGCHADNPFTTGRIASFSVSLFGRYLVCAPASLGGGPAGYFVCTVLVAGTAATVEYLVDNANDDDPADTETTDSSGNDDGSSSSSPPSGGSSSGSQQDPPAGDGGNENDQDLDDGSDDVDSETEPTTPYCSAFESFGRTTSSGEPIGEVVLHREDGSTVSYQGSQSWVEDSCRQALGQ